MVKAFESDWEVLGRTDGSQKLYPCYFCSASTPKFATGWRVKLDTGKVITVGPVCGKAHLGDRFTIDMRTWQAAEKLEAAIARRDDWVAIASEIAATAETVLEHNGWIRVQELKQQTLFMSSHAMKHLDRISAGSVSGVPQYRCFEHGGPRQRARTILRLIEELETGVDRIESLSPLLRDLDRTVDEHNRHAQSYGQEISAFDGAELRAINKDMPQVSWERSGESIIVKRRSDGLEKLLSAPDGLVTPRYPLPRA